MTDPKSTSVSIPTDQSLVDLTNNLSTLLNSSDTTEILQLQSKIKIILEKNNKKATSCLEISKIYEEKYFKVIEKFSRKAVECRELMDGISERVGRLERGRELEEALQEQEPEQHQDS